MHCRLASNQVERISDLIVASAKLMAEHLVAQMQETEPTLEELEKRVLAELHTVGNVTLGALVAGLAPAYAPPTSSCICGGEATCQAMRTAQCKTLLGVIKVRRPYYLCAACHHGHCPLDKELGFCAGSISGGLEALMALLGAEFSFAHAVEVVEKLSLVKVSASRCREATEALGEAVVHCDEDERKRVWEQGQEPMPPPPEQASDPLYMSADGVIVQTEESGSREQCVGAVYTTTPSRRPLSHRRPAQTHPPEPATVRQRSQAISYVSDLGSRSEFSQLLWLEAHRRGLEKAKTLVFIGDGAHWLWDKAEELFPEAIQILDWYHASSYIWKTAQALYPTAEAERTAWADPLLTALWESSTVAVIAQLETLAQGNTPVRVAESVAAREAARTAVTYFTFNCSRMDYKRYRNQGLQTGSGTIESACKSVIQMRLKQAGMRWKLCNARAMGKLRARLKSGRWDEALALRPKLARTYHRQPA